MVLENKGQRFLGAQELSHKKLKKEVRIKRRAKF